MLAVALTTLIALGGGGALGSSPQDPPMSLPCLPHVCRMEVLPEAKAELKPQPVRATGGLVGKASWYDYIPGHAAAGPKLRSMLGKDWRGSKVSVCKGETCIRVTLSDWCQCYKGERRERIIDLDVRAFAALDSPGAGITEVRVSE